MLDPYFSSDAMNEVGRYRLHPDFGGTRPTAFDVFRYYSSSDVDLPFYPVLLVAIMNERHHVLTTLFSKKKNDPK